MQPEDKLLDAFGILADLQQRAYEKAHAITETIGDLRRDVQEIRIDMLQIRTALQQLHSDFVRVAYLLAEQAEQEKAKQA
ncbi:MAG: hypothetical protein NZM06_01330 [Chloroherpetonaceae bacterium]|nr:hypothetical protein [Chloroherpetonaceae bacterium]MDW8436694.1 hypothetical protein [Chloroherpetonaceae bacterium]